MEMDKLIQHLRFCGDLEANCHECERYYEMGANGCFPACVCDLMQKAADALEDQQKRIAELGAQNRWIPVAERLPETTQKYLTVRKEIYGNTIGTNWYFVPCPPDDSGGWNSEIDITHWMPLPELPKEGA